MVLAKELVNGISVKEDDYVLKNIKFNNNLRNLHDMILQLYISRYKL